MVFDRFFKSAIAAAILVAFAGSIARADQLYYFAASLGAASHSPSPLDTLRIDHFATGTHESNFDGGELGLGRAAINYDMNVVGSDIVFDFESELLRAKTHNSFTHVYLDLKVNQPMTYALSGSLTLSGDSNPGGMLSYITFDGYIPGVPGSGFNNHYEVEQSVNVPGGATFTTGVFGEGNYFDYSEGSVTGVLSPDYWYRLAVTQTISDDVQYNNSAPDQGGSATGFTRLVLTPVPVAAVPEPSSMILLGLGMSGIGLASRGRLKRRSADAS